MSSLSLFLGGLKNKSFLKSAGRTVKKINAIAQSYSNFSESDFKSVSAELKLRVGNGESAEKILPQAYALVKAAAARLCGRKFEVCGIEREWGMVHYDVQLEAGIALFKNMVAEIATGEGKTLIATLPLFLYSLYGRGCHVATVNEYLARRDCEWMGNIFSLLGLKCSYVYAGQSAEEKKEAYLADITYGTASEFGFDYLRDNSTASSPADKVQRGFFYCLIDEADSILIDEARTPLIISGYDQTERENPFSDILPSVRDLVSAQVRLSNSIAAEVRGKLDSEGTLSRDDLLKLYQVRLATPRSKILKQILQAGVVNRAFESLHTEISSSINRRLLHELGEELFYVVDEKNRRSTLTANGQKRLNPKNPDSFTIPDADAAVRAIESSSDIAAADKPALMAKERARCAEISERIHSLSQLLQAYSLYERDVDYIVDSGKVEIIDQNTGRVMSGRRWSNGLHQAVEAKEGVKIERENRTYATISIQNYFRMYPKLSGMTGTASEQRDEFAEIYGMSVVEIPTNRPCIRKDLEDEVYLTRREKFNGILRLVLEAHSRGQPVLVGTSSVEDSETLSRMLKLSKIPHNVLNAKNHALEAQIVAGAGELGQITISTNMAGRGTDIILGEGVNGLGGLFVIAAQRHNSARVDRQLTGRCARQGDNGLSVCVISLEDELLRVHADTSFLQKAIKTKHVDGLAFSHPIFPRIIRSAQERLEGEYSAARREMLKFDNPSNRQRSIVYAMRDAAIESDDPVELMLSHMKESVLTEVSDTLPKEALDITQEDIENLCARLSAYLPLGLSAKDVDASGAEKIGVFLCDKISQNLHSLAEALGEGGADASRRAMLASVDSAWRDHLSRLEELRNGIYLRSYAQKDPYCEFEGEAFESFKEFLSDFRMRIFPNYMRAAGFVAEALPHSENRSRRAVVR